MKSIKTKIVLAYAALLLLMTIVGVIGYVSINKYDDEVAVVIQEDIELLEMYNTLALNLAERRAIYRDFMLNPQETSLIDDFKKFNKESQLIHEVLLKNERAKDVHELIKLSEEWGQVVLNDIMLAIASGNEEAAAQAASNLRGVAQKLTYGFSDAQTAQKQFTESKEKSLERLGDTTKKGILFLCITAVVLGLALSVFLANRIADPIQSVSKQLQAIAQGNLLLEPLAVKSQDEVGALAKAANDLIASMHKDMSVLAQYASDLAASSEELSASTEETGASIAEVAQTANEFAATVEQMAGNASSMSNAASKVSNMIIEGETALHDTVNKTMELHKSITTLVSTIQGLGQRSQEIGRIVGVISGIANQTNLLALNAAIEAARAGDHGRGFAVVADEVRQLAEQSANATKDITELVRAIQTETETAVNVMNTGAQQTEATITTVKNTGNTLNNILGSIDSIITQIKEMAIGIQQISTNSQHIAASAEEQSATVEEMAASASSLSEMANHLHTIVDKYQI